MKELPWLTLCTAFLTGLFALLGVYLTQRHDAKKWKSEELRWHVEPFRGRRFDALASLHKTLAECRFSLDFFDTHSRTDVGQFEEITKRSLESANEARTIASIYLNEDQNAVIGDVLRMYRWAAESAADLRVVPKTHERIDQVRDGARKAVQDFSAAYAKADVCLKELLNPKYLASNATNS